MRRVNPFGSAGSSIEVTYEAATSNAATFMGAADRYGAVAQSKAADLVLLDADPLADIHNTTQIRAVLLGGKLFRPHDARRPAGARGGGREGRRDVLRAVRSHSRRYCSCHVPLMGNVFDGCFHAQSHLA